MRRLALTCAVFVLLALPAQAQTRVIAMGVDSAGIARPLSVDTSGGLSATSLDDILSELESIHAAMSSDAVHGNTVIATGPQIQCEAINIDNTAAPNTVTEGQSARVKCNTSGILETSIVTSTGLVAPFDGCTWSSAISGAAVLETEVKATAGRVYAIYANSIDATPVYVRFYNLTAANASEASTPVARFQVSQTSLQTPMGIVIPNGAAFSTAITYRATTGIADNDTGALSAAEVLVNVCYI